MAAEADELEALLDDTEGWVSEVLTRLGWTEEHLLKVNIQWYGLHFVSLHCYCSTNVVCVLPWYVMLIIYNYM